MPHYVLQRYHLAVWSLSFYCSEDGGPQGFADLFKHSLTDHTLYRYPQPQQVLKITARRFTKE